MLYCLLDAFICVVLHLYHLHCAPPSVMIWLAAYVYLYFVMLHKSEFLRSIAMLKLSIVLAHFILIGALLFQVMVVATAEVVDTWERC